MRKINFSYNEIIDAYTNALGGTASSVKIDGNMKKEELINMLSISLNTMVAVNDFIPVNYMQINSLQLLGSMDNGNAGLYTRDISRISLSDVPDKIKNKDVIMAINLAHEFGHYVYHGIVNSKDADLINKLSDLTIKMGETFTEKPIAKLDEYNNKKKNSPVYSNVLEYLASPTEMFARAFSGMVFKESESCFEKGTCFGYNYTVDELAKFEMELKELCSDYSNKILLSKGLAQEGKINTNFLKHLTERDEAIIYKTEDILFDKIEDNQKTNLAAETIVRCKTSNYMQKTFSKAKAEDLKYDRNFDYVEEVNFEDMLNELQEMTPKQVYERDLFLKEKEEAINKQLSKADRIDEISSLSDKLEGIKLENTAMHDSGVKYTKEYKKYSTLRKKESSINDFLNKFDVDSDGKFYSKLERTKLVQFIKGKIVERYDSKLVDVQEEIRLLENQYEKYKPYVRAPIDSYCLRDKYERNAVYEYNRDLKTAYFENGYKPDFSQLTYNHQVCRYNIDSYKRTLEENHPQMVEWKNIIGDTWRSISENKKEYAEIDGALRETAKSILERNLPFYKRKDKENGQEKEGLKCAVNIDGTNKEATAEEMLTALLGEANNRGNENKSISSLSAEANAELDRLLADAYGKEGYNKSNIKEKTKTVSYDLEF